MHNARVATYNLFQSYEISRMYLIYQAPNLLTWVPFNPNRDK